ncbi:serine protease [Asaia bogorensis]|uniref:trypsin-like serine peptidase n=1 Tax=Asaia bogorensis TaxID=91915 RepID=UPI000EFA8170|nr:trypsin-like serine protease [Asaia bogorensis]
MKAATGWVARYGVCSKLFSCVALAALACILPGAALAAGPQKSPLVGVGSGTRHVVDVNRTPWRILGRVQTELGVKCTGFLVAPSVIMTAAHCLWRDEAANFVQPSSVHFMLGYDTGAWRATARGVKFIIPPSYDPFHPLRTSQADHATVILDQPLMKSQDLLPIMEATPGQTAMLGGYQQDRMELAMGDMDCHVIRVRGQLIDHDCAATHGASGAPLLVREGAVWAIAGIDVTAHEGQGGTAAGFANELIVNKTVR